LRERNGTADEKRENKMNATDEIPPTPAATLRAFFKLVRIEYSLFSALGVIVAGLLASDLVGWQTEYGIAFLIVFFCAFGCFAFNDYYDYEADKKNGRYDRPLVIGLLSRRIAVITGLVSLVLAALLSLLINLVAMSLVLASLPLFFLYNSHLKRVILVKNAVIAYAFVATIFLGSLVSDAVLEPLIVYFAVMGFIVGLAFEIMLDIGDVDGDRELKIETFPTRFGVNTAAVISVVLYSVIMLMDPFPFLVAIDARLHFDYVFLFLIFIPVISYFFVSKSLIRDQSKENIFNLKKRVFLTMQVGCLAYLIGVFL